MTERNPNKLRGAHATGDVQAMKDHHKETSPLLSHAESHGGDVGGFIKAIVFGGLDGILTTFAVVTAAAGSGLSTGVVIIMGFANLFADGFAMGFGEYTSSKAEGDFAAQERAREQWELDNNPDGERDEMIAIYEARGMTRQHATEVVALFMNYPDQFVDLMMKEELGIHEDDDDDGGPLKQGLVMFCSFCVFGCVPLLAYLTPFSPTNAFFLSCGLTALCLMTLGGVKGYLITGGQKWVMAALQMLTNGVIAAVISYGISALISSLVKSPVSV